MNSNFVAHASVFVTADPDAVWRSLVDSAAAREYMFGAEVESGWMEGDSIVWRGEWQGNAYEDRGTVLVADPPRLLRYTHCSPKPGIPDEKQEIHTVSFELSPEGGGTRVSLEQDNNATDEARMHSERNWTAMLDALRRHVERGSDARPADGEPRSARM